MCAVVSVALAIALCHLDARPEKVNEIAVKIGPANGRVKSAGPIRTDARAAVVRMDREGNVVAASAVGGAFVNVGEAGVWER